MDNKKFVHSIVKDALFNVRKYVEEEGDSDRAIGIMYSKKTWKKIMLNYEEFRDYAITKNLDTIFAKDGTRHIYYRLIKKEIWQ